MPQTARTAVPELDRETRLLGWIYAAVAPNAVSVPRVEAVLSALVAMPFHVRIDSQGIARRTDELIAAGVAERKSDGVAAVSGEALPLIRDALANDLLEPVLNAFLESRDRGSHELIEYEAMLRGALVAEDDDLFERACQSYPFRDVRWGFLADPFSVDLLNRLPPANRADALDACLAESIDRALPVDAVIDASRNVDGEAVKGWLVELEQEFAGLDSEDLIRMEDAGRGSRSGNPGIRTHGRRAERSRSGSLRKEVRSGRTLAQA